MKRLLSPQSKNRIATALATLAIASWVPVFAVADEPVDAKGSSEATAAPEPTEAAPTLTIPVPPSIIVPTQEATTSTTKPVATTSADPSTTMPTATAGADPSSTTAPTTAQTATGENTSPPKQDLSDAPKTPEYHRVQMRLSGSMCFSCLKDLDESLQRIRGVLQVKIDRPERNYYQPYAPEVSSWAVGTVYYDAAILPLDALRAEIKDHGYHPYKIVDAPSDKPSEPAPNKKK
jgi:copper chaperone CopZ